MMKLHGWFSGHCTPYAAWPSTTITNHIAKAHIHANDPTDIVLNRVHIGQHEVLPDVGVESSNMFGGQMTDSSAKGSVLLGHLFGFGCLWAVFTVVGWVLLFDGCFDVLAMTDLVQ